MDSAFTECELIRVDMVASLGIGWVLVDLRPKDTVARGGVTVPLARHEVALVTPMSTTSDCLLTDPVGQER